MDRLITTLGDGTEVCLYGERALAVTAERCVLIADLHLGKEDLFRRGGISVPQGPTQRDLDRLTELIALSAPERLLVLGDFVHGAIFDAPWLAAWQRWRSAHRELSVVVVAGNHDRHVEAAHVAAFDVEWRRGDYRLGPLLLRHEPGVDSTRHVIAGHLHPGLRLPGIARSLPAFVLGSKTTILPAFASFSGCALMPRDGRMVVCRSGVLVEV